MTKIGYAAMLEQFHPTDLLDWCAAAEAAGFDAGFMVSEHFHPWTPQQGQSAFAWSFMGALGQRTSLPLRDRRDVPRVPLPPGGDRPRGGDARGDVPGPVLARARCRRGAQRARHRRRVAGDRRPQLDDVRGRSRSSTSCSPARSSGTRASTSRSRAPGSTRAPRSRVPIYVATAGPINAKKTGKFADGMITVGAADEKIRMLWDKFDEGCRESGKDPLGTPKLLQIHVSWARDRRGGHPERDEASGPTAGCPSPSRTSRTPRTSRRWPSWSGPRTSRTGS